MISELLLAIETEEEAYAISEIYRLYHKRMIGIAMKILNNHADAEDAMMSAIKYMCEKPQKFLDYKSPKIIYLIRCKTECIAIDMFRRKKRMGLYTTALTEEIEDTAYNTNEESTLDIIINQETENHLYQALKSLKPEYQIPIILKYFHQMKLNEIADLMNMTENSVNVRIFRGRQKLKEICSQMEYFQ